MKKVMFTAFAVGLGLTASIVGQVPSYVPTYGLVGWWPFNGNANDESGNGNNGTVNGATLTADRFGVANKAYSFDGVNDYIQVPDNNSLDITSDISICVWVLGDQTLSYRFVDKSTNGLADAYLLDVYPSDRFRMIVANSTSNQPSALPGSFIPLTLTNITVTYDQNFVKFYINGSLNNAIQKSGISPTNNNPLRFGANSLLSSNLFFKGTLDDIGIWNRALTECEIADLYNAQLGSFSNSTVSINPTPSLLGSNATLSISTPIQNLQWQSNPSNIGWVDLSDNSNYNGVNNDTLVVSNLQLSNHNQPFRVLACGDTSNIATIQIADTCITNVTVYDTLLTTVTDTLIINTTLGLPAPNNENTILIYPNPASDHITIDNGNFAAMAGYSIKIENNAGQQVFQSAINQAQFYVDLSTWTGNGLYFVHLIDPQNNTVTVRKIVLQ
jgi:hypothetical protein